MPLPARRAHTKPLIAANAALLLAAGALFLTSPTDAQQDAPARPRGEYLFVSGEAQGMTTDVIWILDATNEELVALQWNRTNDTPEIIGYRDQARDAARQRPAR